MRAFFVFIFLWISCGYLKMVVAAPPPVRHVVFDLDETLIYSVQPPTDNTSQKNLIAWSYDAGGEMYTRYFRVTDGAPELLQMLADRGVQISFYSAGPPERNAEVLKKIVLPDGRRADALAYKILSADNLVFDETALELKKDLKKYFGDIKNVMIVDDAVKYIKKSELPNLVLIPVRESESLKFGDLTRAFAYLRLSLQRADKMNIDLVKSYQHYLTTYTDTRALENAGRKILKSMRSCLGRATHSVE